MRIADVILQMVPKVEGIEYKKMGHCVFAGTNKRCLEISLAQSTEDESIAKGLHLTLRENMVPVADWVLNFSLKLDGKRKVGFAAERKTARLPRFNIAENKWVNKPKFKDITTSLQEYIEFTCVVEKDEDDDKPKAKK